jgi:hypothetical protein
MANLSNINNKFLVTTGGNVLIGQTSAIGSSIFQVTGSVNITGGTTSGLNITTSGTQDTININRAASNDNAMTKYQTASADKWIVGLRNTSDDNFRFYSYGTSSDVLTINQGNGSATFAGTVIGTIARFDTLNNSANSKNLIYRDSSGAKTVVGGGSTPDKIYILDGGNVGIGASLPASKLHVQGAGEQWVSVYTTDITGAGALNGIRTQSSTNGRQNTLYRNTADNLVTLRAGTDDGEINFIAGGSAAERMRIDSSGNVGIGLDPIYKLDVRGDRIRLNPNSDDFVTAEIQNTTGSFYFGIDTTTGSAFGGANSARTIFSLGDYPMSFYTNSTERMRITSGGDTQLSGNNLDIKGTSAGNTSIRINDSTGTVGTNSLDLINDGTAAYIWNRANTNIRFGINGTERMRITSGGYVAIPNDAGSYSGAASLILTKKSSVPYIQYQYSGTSTSFRLEMDEYVTSGNVRQYFTQTNGGVSNGFSMTFNTGSVIFGDLEVASATQNSGSAFKKDSKARMTLCQGSNSTALTDLQEYFNPNGAVGKIQTSGSATLFTTSSDYRLKEDLQSFSGLEMVSKIPVYDFKWKISDERGYGVMAHELQEVLPQAVGGDKDYEKNHVVKEAKYDDNHNLIKEAEYGKRPSYQTVDYSKIVPLLVKSIQELKAEIELLKSK